MRRLLVPRALHGTCMVKKVSQGPDSAEQQHCSLETRITIKPLLKVKFACISVPSAAGYVQVKQGSGLIHSAPGLLLAP